jgi:probable rRNA maturation factor
MILLDPDLEADGAPKKISAKRAGAPGKVALVKAATSKATAGKSKAGQSISTQTKLSARDVELPSARTLARFLAAAQAAVRLKGQVTVLLTTDAAIAKLNKQFRGKNKATDVLSFPASDGPGAEGLAGDLAISVTTALGQAGEQGHSLSTEIKVLVLHGLLHLAGYDHEADEGQMARRERKLRAELGLPQGLIERVEAQVEKISSGAKARGSSAGSSAGSNVRAKARTLQTRSIKGVPRGLKPRNSAASQSARLQSGPFKTGADAKESARAKSTAKAKRP